MHQFRAFLIAACSVAASGAPNDLRVEGRNIMRHGKPFIPLGFVHAGTDEFPRLVELGFNTVALDLAFRDFDPEKQASMDEADVRKSLQLEFFDAAQEHGLTVLVLFSFHYTPGWLYERFPDARLKKHDGSPGSAGWITMCLDHPGFRDAAEKWLTFAASRLKDHPATLGYILWNEPHLHGDVCYSPHTVTRFRDWLRRRHGDVSALNTAWGTDYTGFDSADAPSPRSGTFWFERYDQAAAGRESGGRSEAAAAGAGNKRAGRWRRATVYPSSGR